jgi:hypothetical protein
MLDLFVFSDIYCTIHFFQFNAEMQQMMDSLPPSYEAVMGYDIPPPPYHCVVNIEIVDEKQKPPNTSASNYI